MMSELLRRLRTPAQDPMVDTLIKQGSLGVVTTDYEAATTQFVAYITALGFPVEDGWDLVNAKTATALIVDAAIRGDGTDE